MTPNPIASAIDELLKPTENVAWLERAGPLLAKWREEDGRCPYCDDTGDVHRADGEWLGECDCDAKIAVLQTALMESGRG